MKALKLTCPILFGTTLLLICGVAHAQRPVVTVDVQQHGNLAAAQDLLGQAFDRISAAQRDNDAHLGGHAERAKELLNQANEEIQLAAATADQGQAQTAPNTAPVSTAPTAASTPAPRSGPPTQQVNLSGSWTIYAENADQPGSSLKNIQINQSGNIISGEFHGPHQHGKLQGWISGNHIEFSTDTRDVLTFRGEITADGMAGLYGAHGQHAPWRAERSQ